jgi:hypothetical protein
MINPINIIKRWFDKWQYKRKMKKRFKKKLEELKKRDPFIYNH